jgi:hypothetical protein
MFKFYPNEDIQVAYLFGQYKHQADETIPVLSWSLLRQLLISDRIMFLFVHDTCLKLFSRPSVAQKLQNELIKLMRILSGGSKQTYILVDAVD